MFAVSKQLNCNLVCDVLECSDLKRTFFNVIDDNECDGGSHNCHSQAQCTNTDGSFKCNCTTGWQGNGSACTGNKHHDFSLFLYNVTINCH